MVFSSYVVVSVVKFWVMVDSESTAGQSQLIPGLAVSSDIGVTVHSSNGTCDASREIL